MGRDIGNSSSKRSALIGKTNQQRQASSRDRLRSEAPRLIRSSIFDRISGQGAGTGWSKWLPARPEVRGNRRRTLWRELKAGIITPANDMAPAIIFSLRAVKLAFQLGRRRVTTGSVPSGYVEDCGESRTTLEASFTVRLPEEGHYC